MKTIHEKLKQVSVKESFTPKTKREKNLICAFLTLANDKDVASFLRDLMTTAEIEEFSNRLEIARLLLTEEMSYIEIAKKVGTSTTTVTRVAQWLYKGCGGYATVLKRMKKSEKRDK